MIWGTQHSNYQLGSVLQDQLYSKYNTAVTKFLNATIKKIFFSLIFGMVLSFRMRIVGIIGFEMVFSFGNIFVIFSPGFNA